MNPSFHSLIGGIEAVNHFIKKRDLDRASGRIVPDSSLDSPNVRDAMTDLESIHLALLDAEAEFMTAIANKEHDPARWLHRHPGSTPPVASGKRTITIPAGATAAARTQTLTDAREEWSLSFQSHCDNWCEALIAQTEKFANAIHVLQVEAPEWSALDQRLTQLMEDFKYSAGWKAGSGDPSTSWGNTFPPSSCSSSSSHP